MTKLDYLNDTYLFESTATFIELKEEVNGTAIILDRTIFYPQGGGQTADTGQIISEGATFIVSSVRLDEDGIVWHFGEFKKGKFVNGDNVTLKIDKDKRILNAILHSAGHLLDCAITQLEVKNIEAKKGFHFPDGPYVEYEGIVENPEELILKLEKTINDLISQDLKIERYNLSSEEATVQKIIAPQGKSVRVVNFVGFSGSGCGGTHVNS